MIDFDNDFFEELRFSEAISVASEAEYAELSKVITSRLDNSNITLYSYVSDKRYFNKYAVRTRGFYNVENFFYDKAPDNPTNIIGVHNFGNNKIPLILTLLQTCESLQHLKLFYFELEKLFLDNGHFKIKLSAPESILTDKLISFLCGMKFYKEAHLIKEDKINDHFIYSKMLER